MGAALRLLIALVITYPYGFQPSQLAAPERIRRAQAVLASTLDPRLPAVPLDTWIRQVVGASARYEWSEGACAGIPHASRPAVSICGVVLAATPDVTATVAVRVGEHWPGESTDRWEPSRFSDAFLDRGNDSLPLEQLSDLPRFLPLPAQQWPKRDVTVAPGGIRCFQDTSISGDVTCSLAITNPGQTTAYARMFIERRPYPDQDSAFVVKLLPGERRTIQLSLSAPQERGTLAVGVELNRRTPYVRAGEHGELTLRPRSPAAVLEGLIDQPDDDELPRDILMVRGTFTGMVRSFEVPVDSSVSRLAISVELDQGVTATLFRPRGVAVSAADGDVGLSAAKRFELARASMASESSFMVTAPEAGIWRLELTAAGESTSRAFAVTARGTSATSFDSFDLVALQDGVHGGYFDIPDAMPVAGATIAGQARLSDRSLDARFRLIDGSGTLLQTLDLKKDDRYAPYDPAGSLTVPAVPFFVVMEAADGTTSRIQRQYPVLFQPQTVGVSFTFDQSQIPAVVAGSTTQFRFAVTNHGAATATFAPTVRATGGEVRDVLPRTVSLQPGSSATVTFSLVVPPGPDVHDIKMQLAATHVSDARLTNSTDVRLEIAPADDVDHDYVKNDVDNCPKFPNDQHDDDRDGIGDPCDPSPWSPVAILDFQPKKGPVGTTVTISGRVFAETVAENRVTFGHVPARIVKATTTELVVIVPEGAPSFLIFVHAPKGTAGSFFPFAVEKPAAGPRQKTPDFASAECPDARQKQGR
jgi:hypothetical protein